MLIKKLELENIKSHRNSTFEFSRGTTAITGENGAGKTTIIEAIAWALFDVLDYKKDEFRTRGTKKGSVYVTFESSADGRDYVVYRDTGAGYYVYDPRIGQRIAEKRIEVCRFLWQHLGVEPGTDLTALFKHAIGVPQGTLTAIFLASPAERKTTFDTLLKVEEYRRAASELLQTQRFIEQQIADLRESLGRAEGQLEGAEDIENELAAAKQELAVLADEIEKLTGDMEAASASLDALEKQATAANEARSTFDRLTAEKLRCETIVGQKRAELAESGEARERIAEVRDLAEQYERTLGRITELERERAEREKLRHTLRDIETAEARVKTDEKHTRERFDRILAAHAEIARLRPLMPEQERLEKQVESARQEVAREQAQAVRKAALEARRDERRAQYREADAELAAAREAAKNGTLAKDAEKREAEIVARLAAMRAELERDERFQAEIKGGLCPILSERCLNLKDGQTLEGFVSSQFDTLRAGIAALETERSAASMQIKASRDAERAAERAVALEQRLVEIATEGKSLAAEIVAADEAAKRAAEIEGKFRHAESALRELGDPRGRVGLLENEAALEAEVREAIGKIESNIERLESDRRLAVEELEKYKDLDAMWDEAVKVRDGSAQAHRTFLKYSRAAEVFDERAAGLTECEETLRKAEAELAEAEAVLRSADAAYDAARHNAAREELSTLRSRAAAAGVRRENSERRIGELEEKLEKLSELRKELDSGRKEKLELDKTLETTQFIRDTLKEAAPLVARNYVYHISAEANNLFREIFGNAEQTLRWCEDYGIVLEEGGHERTFQSLSGGEQMAAALAVRLALLKQLSDIRIAFFDEPTTNMDAERRENLAMQIGQITHFDQLFVISHDDTFEGYLDHEMRIEKE